MNYRSRAAHLSAGLALVVGPSLFWGAPALASSHWTRGGDTIFVSNLKTDTVLPGLTAAMGNSGRHGSLPDGARGCATAQFTTIGAAVSAAASGTTIVVCPGVYPEMVTIPPGKALTLEGIGDPVINANGLTNGVQVLGSGTTVEGLSIGYANGEGILVGGFPPAAPVSNVTIRDNRVFDNDRGNPTGAPITTASYPECNQVPQPPPVPALPGDCGEAIHLLSATNSAVMGNRVSANSGGILITDEDGPADGNTIASNIVTDNTLDCGITLASHATSSTSPPTPVAPGVGGIYNNTVRGNLSLNNGVLGQGAGILLATGNPGGAVYDNTVEGNITRGNGLAGVTLHSHAPGEDLNGNVIRGNIIGVNNLDGDADFGSNTPPDVDMVTTGIIVAAATGTTPASTANPLSVTIVGNRIANDATGIWVTKNVTATTTDPPNVFVDVTSPMVTAP